MADINNFNKESLGYLWSDKIKPGLAEKIDKVPSATSGHLAKFNGSGQVVDGGDTADYAKNLVAPVVQSDAEFVFRKTGGNLSVDGAGGAVLQRIKGKTLALNQLVLNGNFADGASGWNVNGGTLSVSGGIATISATASTVQLYRTGMPAISGHKYLFKASVKFKNNSYVYFSGGTNSPFYETTGNWQTIAYIDNTAIGGSYPRISTTVASVGDTIQVSCFYVVDLTLLYGSEIGGMTDAEILAKFESEFPGYHDYNPGTLISNDASAIETVGFNLWDEEWELGYWDSTGWHSNSNFLGSKNYIDVFPATDYYFMSPTNVREVQYWDANKNYINRNVWNEGAANSFFTTPSSCHYITFYFGVSYGATYNHDICINLSDPAKNGTYEPYKKTVTQLNLGSFQVRDSQGNVTTITGGLKSAGDVYDEIVGNKYIKRVGSVDMGTLAWRIGASYFLTQDLRNNMMKYPPNINTKANVICPKYITKKYPGNDKEIVTTWEGAAAGLYIGIKDSSYSDADIFKNDMSGVMLYYELATPIEYELVTVPDYTYPVDGDGTERRLPEDTASSVHAPFRADILYALNGSATLRNLDANYVRNDNIKQDTGNNENTVMSQAAVTREFEGMVQRIDEISKDTLDLSYWDPINKVQTLRRNTANTYVVFSDMNSSGRKFRFPLVYGNAIKNGVPNPAAYTRIVSDYTADFVNHLGNTITDPWIERNMGCTISRAQCLWGTILHNPSIKLVDGWDGKYIEFDIPSSADSDTVWCIELLDANNDILWSWNIWYIAAYGGKPQNLKPETIINHTGISYEMMPRPLCSLMAGEQQFQCAYYQWGRKDIMGFPRSYNESVQMNLYQGGDFFNIGTYGVADDSDAGGTVRSVANAIKMPHKFFLEYDNTKYNWNNLPWFNNFWNAAETASSELADNQLTAIKTIYDPCPVGYMIPGPRAWTGFTSTGSNSSTSSEFNVIGSFANGWKFKKNSSDATGTFYPASGCRYRTSGALSNVGSYGYFWSFAPYSQTYARHLYFYSGYVCPLSNDSRAYGFAVRPSREY